MLAASAAFSTPISHSLQPLNIGRGAGGIPNWRGLLDEVAIYGTALSGPQIAQHYSRGTRPGYGSIAIELLQPGNPVPVLTVAGATTNDGEFTWTVPSSLAEGSYLIRVTSDQGILPSDTSDASFLVVNGGADYYVNDNSTAGDVFTTAIGDNAASGKRPDAPLASLAALLFAYDLDAGDVVHVDAGTYRLLKNLSIGTQDSGVRIEGPGAVGSSSVALLNRNNTTTNSYAVELTGADDVTLDYLSITGASTGVFASGTADSDRITISNSEIFGNANDGINIGASFNASSDNALITGNRIHDNIGGSGIRVEGPTGTTIRNNIVFNHAINGINVSVLTTGPVDTVENNEVFGNAGTGISISSINVTIQGNRVHHNSRGIEGSVLITGNQVYMNRSAGGGAFGIRVTSGGQAIDNVVYDNDLGIVVSQASATRNRVFRNRNIGISVSGTTGGGDKIEGNTVYSNPIGIQVEFFSGLIANNLVYDSSQVGVWYRYGFGTGGQILNNTIYQAGTGDALSIDNFGGNGATAGAIIRNNILRVAAGYALTVSANAEIGLISDYNEFVANGTGKLIRWEGQDFTGLADWFFETGYDQHSIAADPQLVNAAGADGLLGFKEVPLGPAQVQDENTAVLTGTWVTQTFGGFGGDHIRSTTGSASATWTFSGLNPGSTYQVAATWPNNNPGGPRFALLDGTTLKAEQLFNTFSVDFTDQGASWIRLGTVTLESNSLQVRLAATNAFFTADAIRIIEIRPNSTGDDGDFHVQPGSPTIDAGDPVSPFGHEPGPNGGRANLGHSGNTVEATASPAQLLQIYSPSGLDKFENNQQVSIRWHTVGITDPAGTYADAVAANNPVAYYRLGEPSGTTAADSSGNGLNGTYLGTPVLGVPGSMLAETDSAIRSVDTNLGDGVTVADAAALRPAQLTVEAWVNPDTAGYGNVLTKSTNFGDGYGLFRDFSTGRMRFFVNTYSFGGIAETAVPTNQWSHVVGTYDGTAVRIYVNGVLAATTVYSTPIIHSLQPLNIGRYASGNSPWHGMLDEVAVYGTALTGAQIAQHYSRGIRPVYGTAAIELLQQGNPVPVLSIAAATTNDGELTWTVPASLPEGNYLIRVTSDQGTHPSDTSDIPFLIANSGTDYYVNDASTDGDVFTTAVGNNFASGKSPDQPMRTLRALINAYDLDAGDVIHVDAGTYRMYRGVQLEAQDSGVRIEGPGAVSQGQVLQSVATLNRGNTSPAITAFDGAGADDVTIDHLSITGANTGINVPNASGTHRLTVSNSDIFGHAGLTSSFIANYGVFVDLGNDDFHLTGSRIHNVVGNTQSAGVFTRSIRSLIDGNEVFGNLVGIQVVENNSTPANRSTVSNNTVHDNTSVGIQGGSSVANLDLIVGNTVFGHTATGAAGIVGSGNDVVGNVVYNNYNGIRPSTSSANNVIGNRVFRNSHLGIQAGQNSNVSGNQVYSNTVGIQADNLNGGTIANNVVYGNTNQGILIQGSASTGPTVVNNTVYQVVGDAVRLQNSASNVKLRNNILWIDSDFAIFVDTNSQTGFTSNNNLLHQGTDPNAHIGRWAGVNRHTLADWQAASLQDAASVSADPLFVDRNGADNVLGYRTADNYDGGLDDNLHLLGGSPAIDRADSSLAPTLDREGNARVDDPGTPNLGTPPALAYVELGAYEFQGSSSDTTPPTVISSVVHLHGPAGSRFSEIHVTFSEPLDPIDANAAANYELREAGGNLLFGDADDTVYSLTPHYAAGSTEVTLDVAVAGGVLPHGLYRFTISGNTSIHDQSGLRLDGDNDGQAGGDHVGINSTPVLDAISDPIIDEGQTLSFSVIAADTDTLAYSLGAGAPAGASIHPTTGLFTWTPGELDGPGMYPITVIVTDNGSPVMSDQLTFTVTVREVNNPPVFTPVADQSVDELALLSIAFVAVDPDTPANAVTYSLGPGAPDGASIDPTTGQFTWTPDESQGPGAYDVTVVATDDGTPNLSNTLTIHVTVNELNEPPVLGSLADRIVQQHDTLTFQASATDADLPANSLTFSLDAGAPSGASIDPATGVFTWTPTEADVPGTFPITFRVTDDGAPNLSDSQTITVTVTEGNRSPILAAIGNQTVAEAGTLSFTAIASDADAGQTHTFSLGLGAPLGASIDPTSGLFTWTLTNDSLTPLAITIVVTDNGIPTLSDSETIQVTVLNLPPSASAGGPYVVAAGGSLTLHGTGSDPNPNDVLTYRWDLNEDGLFGDATGPEPALSWAQLESLGLVARSNVNVFVEVSDGRDTTSSAPTNLTINYATVMGRHLFYNQSGTATHYDHNDPAINSFDDLAIAADKTAYLWEDAGAATFANVSSYDKGINGIMVDIAGSHPSITAADFIFRVGNNNAPGTWAAANPPTAVSVRAGAGVNGSDRVEIVWTSGAPIKQWLEVIIKANANTGLAQKPGYPAGHGDAFFFGSAVGNTGAGDTSANSLVNAIDQALIRANNALVSADIPITNVYDVNRSASVNASDEMIARLNSTNPATTLKYLNLTAAPAAPEAASALESNSGDVGGDAGVASALAAPALPRVEVGVPKWLVNRLEEINLNSVSPARLFQHLGDVSSPRSRALLSAFDAVDLDEVFLESVFDDLGLRSFSG